MERAEGELLKKGVSKRKRLAQERHSENRKLKKTKAGKEIVYSASPGGEKNRYHNTEFEKSHKITPEIFNNNNDDTQ